MLRKTLMLALLGPALLVMAACAPGPNAVAPIPMPVNTYMDMNCVQAKAEHTRVTNEVAALSQKQKNAAVGDAIGVFLIAVPVSSLTGNDVQGDLAVSKGKLLAAEARLNSCR